MTSQNHTPNPTNNDNSQEKECVGDSRNRLHHSQDGLKAINPECNSLEQDVSRSRKVRGHNVGENPTPDKIISPLEQAKEIEKGCGKAYWKSIEGEPCGSIFEADEEHYYKLLCPECKSSAKTLLQTCEWIREGKGMMLSEYNLQEIKKAIEKARRILV